EQRRPLARLIAWLLLRFGEHSADHAAFVRFSLIQHRKGAAQTQLLGIARVDTRNERPDEPIEHLSRKLSSNKVADRFVFFRGTARPHDIAQKGKLGAETNEARPQKRRWTHRHLLKRSVHQHVAWRPSRSPHNLLADAELIEQTQHLCRAAETLRPQFEQI